MRQYLNIAAVVLCAGRGRPVMACPWRKVGLVWPVGLVWSVGWVWLVDGPPMDGRPGRSAEGKGAFRRIEDGKQSSDLYNSRTRAGGLQGLVRIDEDERSRTYQEVHPVGL